MTAKSQKGKQLEELAREYKQAEEALGSHQYVEALTDKEAKFNIPKDNKEESQKLDTLITAYNQSIDALDFVGVHCREKINLHTEDIRYKAVNNSLISKNKDTINLITKINKELTYHQEERSKRIKAGASLWNTDNQFACKLIELAFATEFLDKKILFPKWKDQTNNRIYLKEPSTWFKEEIAMIDFGWNTIFRIYSNSQKYVEQVDKSIIKYRELLLENKLDFGVNYSR